MERRQLIKREIFYFLSVLIGLFIGLEIIWPNIVLAYFNLNWLIVLWVLAGIFYLIKK